VDLTVRRTEDDVAFAAAGLVKEATGGRTPSVVAVEILA